RNQFFGGQLGFESEFRSGRWFADITGKIALGDINQLNVINGITRFKVGPNTTEQVGGLLALGSNQTNQSDDSFAYVPELTVKLGYQVLQRVSLYVGYNVLYM